MRRREILKLWRKEIKIEEEVGKDQNCGEGGNSRMRRGNNKIVEEGIKKLIKGKY